MLSFGGGQAAPILVAAGAQVVSFDRSDEQLAKYHLVAVRDNLDIHCIQGNMADLSMFLDREFDLIFHPASNRFVPDVVPVWRMRYRVLNVGSRLLAGFMNPAFFLFDHETETDELVAKFKLPNQEPENLSSASRAAVQESNRAIECDHMLESQIGGQLAAGFILRDLYEDYWNDEVTPLNRFSPTSIVTWVEKYDF